MQHALLIGQIRHDLQEKSYISASFSARIKALRSRAGFRSDAALCNFIGISRSHLNDMRTGKEPVSEKSLEKLADAERRLSEMADIKTEEPRAKYGNNKPENRYIHNDTSSLKVNTGFRTTPGEPTAEDCISYLAAYVAEARYVPGAVGRTWFELQRNFSLPEIKKLRAEAILPEDINRGE